MPDVTPSMQVGQLVAERPGRARVFERLGIDYCCGGRRTLSEACLAQGLNVQTVIAELREGDRKSAAVDEAHWAAVPLEELITNILDTHHAYLRRELPRLTEITAKVRGVHGERHPELAEVQETYNALRAELELHMTKEERVLFPMIKAMESSQILEGAHGGSVRNPIRVMQHEHDSAGAALAHLRKLTRDFEPPADGCNTYRAMLHSLAELEADLHQHIHKENNILFPRAMELEATLAQATPVQS